MNKVRFWLIQALMGLVLVLFAFFGFIDTSTLPLFRLMAAYGDEYGYLAKGEPRAAPSAGAGASFKERPAPPGFRRAVEVDFARYPGSIEEFLRLREFAAERPEGAAALFILALNIYGQRPSLGEECVKAALDEDRSPGIARSCLGYFFSHASTARSYVSGTSAADGYRLPEMPWSVLLFSEDGADEARGVIRLYAGSSGAEGPRSVELRESPDGWRVSDFYGLVDDMDGKPSRNKI